MQVEFGISRTVAILGMTTFTLGFGFAPMVIAPLSEVVGRSPIYIITFFIFALFQLPIALAPNVATVLISRFIVGSAASTGATMVGGSLADIFHAHKRGNAMSFYAWAALSGVGLGPIWAGYTAERKGWRWIAWIQLIVFSVYFFFLLVMIKETRGSVLLSRKAAQLRRQTGDQRIRAPSDDERSSLAVLIKISLTRPFFLLFREPIVTAFALYIGFCWGCLYLFLESIPIVFGRLHHLSASSIGLIFITVWLGPTIGYVTNPIQERIYRQKSRECNGHPPPETRLYGAIVGGISFAVGLWIFAWTSFEFIHWIVPCIGVLFIFLGLYYLYLAIFNYMADSYHRYASSAMAAQSLLRNVFGAVFPLFTVQLYDRVGVNWASTLIASLATIMIVVPFFLYFKGAALRAKSKFAGQLQHEIEHAVAETASEAAAAGIEMTTQSSSSSCSSVLSANDIKRV
eukprot:TRINITY_DN2129_c0_g1_i2.p1 TRINITY_DN2129_c0_g1~~TRINITY_DN2129_c0_g1_i2.p1  ORF type:complete len:458 (-),score=38.01 TRINITY_DN2129_c0_g1_i2:7-1380(-)